MGRAQSIFDDLRDAVLHGRYRPGDRVPSERELAARTGAHRSSAREALKKLEALGLVDIAPGGARVAPLRRASLDVLPHLTHSEGRLVPSMVRKWLELQEILLIGSLPLAVERASDAQLARARALLERLAAPDQPPEALADATEQLLRVILEAADNVMLAMIAHHLHTAFVDLIAALPAGARRPRPPRRGLTEAAHRIRQALAERDVAGVQQGVRQLLQGRTERLLGLLR